MRKLVLSLALFIGASAFTVVGDPAKDIVGKWKYSETSYAAAKKVLIERTRKVSPEVAEQIEAAGDEIFQLFPMLTFEYNANGKYEFTTPQGPQGGDWKISEDGKYLIRTNSQGIQRKDSIMEVTPQKLKLMDSDFREVLEYVKAE